MCLSSGGQAELLLGITLPEIVTAQGGKGGFLERSSRKEVLGLADWRKARQSCWVVSNLGHEHCTPGPELV